MTTQAQEQAGGRDGGDGKIDSVIPAISSWEPFNDDKSVETGDFREKDGNTKQNNNTSNTSNNQSKGQMSNMNVNANANELGLQAAQSLLQKLQHQLLYGDSPPGNELHHLHQHHRALHASEQQQQQQQQQQQPPPPLTNCNGKTKQQQQTQLYPQQRLPGGSRPPYASRQRHDTSQAQSQQSSLSATTCAVLHQVLEQRGWTHNYSDIGRQQMQNQHPHPSLLDTKPSGCLSLLSQSRSASSEALALGTNSSCLDEDENDHGIPIQQSHSSASGSAIMDSHADNLSVDESVSEFVETLLIGRSSPGVHPVSTTAAASSAASDAINNSKMSTVKKKNTGTTTATTRNINDDGTTGNGKNGVSRRLFSPSKQQTGADEEESLLFIDGGSIAGEDDSSSCITKFDPTPDAQHGAYLQFDPNHNNHAAAEKKSTNLISPTKQQKLQQSQHTPRDHAYFVQKQLHQKAAELNRDLINPHKSIQVMGHDSLVKWMQDVSVQQQQFEQQQEQLQRLEQQQQRQEEASQKSSQSSSRRSKSKAALSPDDFLKRMIPSPREHAAGAGAGNASLSLFASTSHDSPSNNNNPYSPHSPNHRQGPLLVPTYASVSSFDVSSSESESQSESENEADAESDAESENDRSASPDDGQGTGGSRGGDSWKPGTNYTLPGMAGKGGTAGQGQGASSSTFASVPEQRAVTPRNQQHVGLMQQHQQLTTATPATPTLKQFGSEYARFLSQTPFTPQIPSGKKRATPLNKLSSKVTSSAVKPSRLAGTPHHHTSTPLGKSKSSEDGAPGTPGAQGSWHTPDHSGSAYPSVPGSHSMPTPAASNVSNMPRPSSAVGKPPTHVTTGGGAISSSDYKPPSSMSSSHIQLLEDASPEVLAGAILDICVTYGHDTPPPHSKDYYRIAYTSTGHPANLNHVGGSDKDGVSTDGTSSSSSTTPIYLNVKKEPNWSRAVQRPCIVSLVVIFPDRNEFVPPGYCVVKRYKPKQGGNTGNSSSSSSSSQLPANLNYGRSSSSLAGGASGSGSGSLHPGSSIHHHARPSSSVERVYLCYKRSREGNPVTGILPLLPRSQECIPPGYTVLEQSPRNYVANVNEGAGPPVFLAVRQRLSSLEPARPDPLLKFQLSSMVQMQIQMAQRAASKNKNQTQTQAQQINPWAGGLYGYYATGGTMVASSTLGKLHVMDRMAHPRFSPSSMATRMTLAYKSPAKGEFQPSYQNEARTPLLMHRHANRSLNSGSSYGHQHSLSYCSDIDSSASVYSTSTYSTTSEAVQNSMHGGSITNQTATTLNSDGSTSGSRHRHSNNMAQPYLLQDADSVTRDSVASTSFDVKSLASELSHSLSMTEGENRTLPYYHDPPESAPLPSGSASSTWDNDETSQSQPIESYNASLTRMDMLRLCQPSMDFIPSITLTGHLGACMGWTDQAQSQLLLEQRTTLLTPILTACYTYHGGSALLAVEGLTSLLTESDFFLTDVVAISEHVQGQGSHSVDANAKSAIDSTMESPLLCPDQTLLDVAIQTVCDVATSTSREIYFSSCIQFCVEALRYAKRRGGGTSRLHSRTMGYVLRLHLFVFSFGTSLESSSSTSRSNKRGKDRSGGSRWSSKSSSNQRAGISGEGHGDSVNDVPFLGEEPLAQFMGIDATELAASALKEMATLMVEDVWRCREQQHASNARAEGGAAASAASSSMDMLSSMMNGIVLDMVDSTADRVNASNLLNLATHQIHRGGGSELFWYDMTTSCGLSLFDGTANDSTTEYILAFALLACFSKAASGGIRRTQGDKMFVPRDISTKLLSLELLSHCVQCFFVSDKERHLHEPQGSRLSQGDVQSVYSMRRLVVPCIVSNTSLCHEDPRTYRRCIVIVNAFLTRSTYRKHLKIELGVLIDLYVMFLLRSGPRFSRAGGFCRCVQFEQQVDALSLVGHWFANRSLLVELFYNYDAENEDTTSWNFAATKMDMVGQLFSVMCALAGKSSKVISDNLTRKEDSATKPLTTFLSVDEKDKIVQASRALQFLAMTAMGNAMRSLRHLARDCAHRKDTIVETPQPYSQLTLDNELANTGLTAAFDILAAKGLKKAMEYLIACNILTPSARDIATFLRVHQQKIPAHLLGDFLGEGSDSISDHWDMIRYHYVRAISFVDMNVEEALRHFLQNCGFHLPGEAQRIERVIATFSQTYFEDNVGDLARCPFQQQDTVFLLSYAIIMLNTDLHKAPETKPQSGRKRKRMTQQEFKDNLKRAVPGEDLPKEYVHAIYDSIEAVPMIINGSTGPLDTTNTPYTPIRQSSLQGRGSDDASSDRSSSLREQFASNLPLSNAIKTSQELLRGLSLEEHQFFMSNEDFNVSPKMIESIMSCTWFHFHDIVKSVLETPQPSRDILLSCLDTVHSALSCIIYCNMNVDWHVSFVKLLAQIKFLMDRMDMMYETAHSDLKRFIVNDDYSRYTWYTHFRDFFEAKDSDRASRSTMRKTLDTLVQSWRQLMKKQLDPAAVIQLDRVSRRIRNGSSLVKKGDSSRLFLREGNLVKHCSNGQKKVYRFFLFSDRLLYGHRSSAHGDYKIHEELPLSAMKVEDVHKAKYAESFHIIHPIKKFTVSAHSQELKNSWMDDLRAAIQKSMNLGIK